VPPGSEGAFRALALVGAGALGLVVGSFLNVVVYRLPLGRSVVSPGSACPSCRAPIRWFDNIPVVSWLLLRGRCRACRAPVSPRYALVELLTGGLFVAACAALVLDRGGLEDPQAWRHFAAALGLLSALVALSFIDLDHRILPDRITKPGMLLGPLCSAFLALRLQPVHLLPGLRPPLAALVLSLAGIAVGWGSLRLVAWAGGRIFRQDAMGLGDAKLMGMVGGFVGPVGVALAIGVGFLLGLVGGALHALRKGEFEFPFGPPLAAGAALVLLVPGTVVDAAAAAESWMARPAGSVATAVTAAALLVWIRRRLPGWLFGVLAAMVALMLALAALALARG
jgi:leader peptidase (prepilin peptidase)/N-methyltransferase